MFSYNMGAQTTIVASDLQYLNVSATHRSISISLGDTYYSGTVDVLTGVLTVTHKQIDVGNKIWSETGTSIFYCSTSDMAALTGANVLCDTYLTANNASGTGSAGSWTDLTIRGQTTGERIFIKDLSFETAAAFKTGRTGTKIVYPLATPTTIQLTPQEVESLLGDNTLWSDANGDLTVTYRSN